MKIFKKLFKFGNAYAVTQGDYLGQILVYMESNKTHKGFITIPKLENLWVPKNEFDNGLESGILDFIEKLPHDTKITLKAQFKQNETTGKEL